MSVSLEHDPETLFAIRMGGSVAIKASEPDKRVLQLDSSCQMGIGS